MMAMMPPPTIITDNLVFHLDCADKTCLQGHTNTWSSLTSASSSVAGQLTNGAAISLTATNGNGAIDFDGTNDYAAFTLPPMGTCSFTQDIWVKQDTFTNWQTWVSTSRSSTGFNMGTDADGDVVWFDGSRKLEADGVMDPNDDGAGTGIWRFITYTRDANNSGAAVAYMDGVQVDTGTISSNQKQTTGSVGDLDRGSERTNGQIAIVRFYKDVVFTPAMVLHNFNAQRHRFGR